LAPGDILQDGEVRKKIELLEDHSGFGADLLDVAHIMVSSIPSTMIWPRWCSSRRLMVRIKVDFPNRKARR